jgi:prepilin-type N-terminal cleavage/methylation domain-containing protein
MNFPINYQNKGLTLIEIILTIALISIIMGLVFSIYFNLNSSLIRGRIYLQILSSLQDEIEKIKIMRYEDIGISGGWPPGVLPQEKIIEKSEIQIKVKYFIRNIDDPRDGTVTSTPADTAPADYKLVELEGICLNCSLPLKPQKLSSIIAPKNVESVTRNGSLFIQVINANGEAVSLANVKVDYLNTPTFTIQDLTDNTGFLRLIDIPPGINAYSISVTKEGYSYEKTYPPGSNQNPNPILPHQTVKSQELTTVTFQIDRLSRVNFNFLDKMCKPMANLEFNLKGAKLIGRNPDVLKTDITTTTDENGKKNLILEWDTYTFNITDSRYVLKGSVPYIRPNFIVQPNSNYSFKIITSNLSPINLLVSVFDENNNFLSDAEVKITDRNSNLIASKITGEDLFREDDWSNNNYSEISLNIDPESFREEIRLKDLGGYYSTTTEYLISKTIDFGTSSDLIYKKFKWQGSIPQETTIKFQLAANNDNQTWNFIGPDGTENTFFEIQNFDIPLILNNKRYFRYKVYLQTNNPSLTPSLDKISIYYSSPCLSPGEVLFENLQRGDYNLEVIKQGYQIYNQSFSLSTSEPFKEIKVNLISQ